MRLVVFFILLAALLLASWMLWGAGMEESFSVAGSITRLREAGPWGYAVGVILLLGDVVIPIPSTLVISAMGYLYGVWIGGFLASGGLMLAGMAGYGIGRLCGEQKARRWLGDADFVRGQALFSKGGGWVVALSRALPILPEVISCTAGLVRMPFKSFLAALTCGSVPMGFLFAAIGHAGQEAPTWAVVFSLVIPAILWAAASRMK